jgi:hypothetical protein
MRFAILALATLIACATAAPAGADVVSATPSTFVLHAEQTVPVNPAQAWTRLARVGDWWSSGHTYSGNSRNLSLDLRAGGCWCERWNGGAVEHARVLLILNRDGVRTLRLDAPLGPLQEMAVNAVLTFTVAPDPAGAKIEMTYRVSGDANLSLDQVGPGVNAVIMEQFGRLIRLVTSGSPG